MSALCDDHYAIPGTIRPNDITVATANGLATPTHKCDAKIPVLTVSNQIRFIKLTGALMLDNCSHNLLAAGAIASEQRLSSWIAPQQAVVLIFSFAHTVSGISK